MRNQGRCSWSWPSCKSRQSLQPADCFPSGLRQRGKSPDPWGVWSQTVQEQQPCGSQHWEPCPWTTQQPHSGSKDQRWMVRTKPAETTLKHNCQGLWEIPTSLGSFFAMFLRAKMASMWRFMGRAAAPVDNPGSIFMMGLRLAGWPALPRTLIAIIASSKSRLATDWISSSCMGCKR